MKQLTMDDVQRIVGALFIENAMLREALAKAQPTVKVESGDEGNTGEWGLGDKPRPLNSV